MHHTAPRRAGPAVVRRAVCAAILAFTTLIAMTEFAAAAPAEPAPGDRISGSFFATRSPVIAPHGAAATAHPLATQVALDILKDGGSAVDAAIAANAALGLMEPTGNGIGGDLFAIVWDPETQKLHGLNASGRSPKSLSLEEVRRRAAANEGPWAGRIHPSDPISVSVPGAVDGWFELHDRFGALPMRKILKPAITYAEEGFPLTQLIAYYWGRSHALYARRAEEGVLPEFANAEATYFPGGRAPVEGEIFRNPDLAQTYRRLAKRGGRKAFYGGELAEVLEAYMARIGGFITAEDMAAHRSTWVEPVSVNYRGYDVWELPPNGQGIAALQMLQILEAYDLKAMGFASAEALHVMVEAKRLAFEDRAKFYADPDYYEPPTEALLTAAYADRRRALISADQAMPTVGAGDPAALEDGDTTYLTVADQNGMMVSLIQSNYRGMGTGLVPDGLGFMLQNRGELFSLTDGHANVYAPGKRPFHTIIPAFVTKDGAPWMSFGLMGGGMQPQGHVQIITNMIDFGMNVQEAGDAARWRHDGSTEPTDAPADGVGVISVESGVSAAARQGLEARGHVVRDGNGGFGGYQAIWRDPKTGVYHAASEMRKDGAAGGY